MSQEIERCFPSVYYPSFLGVQRQPQTVKNRLSLTQIKLWSPTAQDHEVIGISHNVSIMRTCAEAPFLPNLVQPVQVKIC